MRLERALTVLFALSVTWPGLLFGQERPSRDPIIIAAQLREGLQYQQMALQQLRGAQTPESLQAADQLIYRAYVQVRLAHGGVSELMEISKTRGFQDPMLAWESQRIQYSRDHIRGALSLIRGRRPDPREMAEAINHLNSAAALLEQVLGVMP